MFNATDTATTTDARTFPVWEPPKETQMPSLPSRLRRLGTDSAYVLTGLPFALINFILVITLLSVAVGTLVIWVGVPLLTLTLTYARGASAVERGRIRAILDRPIPDPPEPVATGGSWSRLTTTWREPQAWLNVLWAGLVDFIVATITFCVGLTWWLGALCAMVAPLTRLVLARTIGLDTTKSLGHLLGGGLALDVTIDVIVGLIFAATLPLVMRALATWRALVSYGLLCSRAAHAEEIRDLTDSRNAVRRAETDALRRLERDIHDGPQQRLVRLNMDMARARRLAATDPEAAQMVLADAMAQSQETLAELRQLSRGIAPPILVDRGLVAAVQEAAARSEVPIDVALTIPDDLPDHVQTASYFVIAEALVNINKHAEATSGEVNGSVVDDRLVITITDNGRGGASLAKGHGLAGLATRLEGVDGDLQVESPLGGPTLVQAVIPCGS